MSLCEGFFFLYVVVFLFFSFRFFLICHLFLIYPLFIIFVLPRLELNQRRDMCIPCFSVLLLKEISSISPDTTSNTTRVKTRIKQHAKMECCGARRGDTHITELAQGYVYPLFFCSQKEISSISSNTTSNTTRVKTRIKQHAKMECCGARRGIHRSLNRRRDVCIPCFFFSC